ncbi:hypothetical protein ACLK1Z_02605 [Escherichia coli]
MNLSSWFNHRWHYFGRSGARWPDRNSLCKWTYLWEEWLTSVDHKRLGIMYIIVAIVMLLRGFGDAIMMRSQQALASAGEAGLVHLTTTIRSSCHGVIKIFFVRCLSLSVW